MENDVIDFLEQSNFIEDVRDGLDQSVKAWQYIIKKKEMTCWDILQTHKILMYKQGMKRKDRGYWRSHNVMLTRKEIVGVDGDHILSRQVKIRDIGVPWKKVADEMLLWVRSLNGSLTEKYLETEEHKAGACIALHISFENIHPFADGNGRMGRILLNWQRTKMGLPILVIREEDRQKYYQLFKDKIKT